MEGYAKLARLMGNHHTDGHFLIFQKFEQLSAQNLLYLQAEIVDLQESLAVCVKEDSEHPEKQNYATDWYKLSSSAISEQWETWLQLRKKLKEYYEAIARHRMISSLPPPHKSDLNFLQLWLVRPGMGDCAFRGGDRDIYEGKHASGLGTLATRTGEIDPLTRFLLYALPRIYHCAVVSPLYNLLGKWVKKPEVCSTDLVMPETDGISIPQSDQESASISKKEKNPPLESSSSSPTAGDDASSTYAPSSTSSSPSPHSFDLESNIFLYRDSYFHHIANILGTLISSLIPIAAIVILYLLSDMKTRLAVVCAFTAIFAIALSLVTDAKRVEIFAATAAFASVQVVFVGSTSSSGF